ncbi:MAG: FixH family protein [Bacteroidota bacterium]
MNWGNKIALSFIAFAAFILFMVIKAFHQDFDLVSEDYYAREMNYEKQLIQQANLRKLGDKVEVQQLAGQVTFTFPSKQEIEEGEIHFYHPSRKMYDKRIKVSTGKLMINHNSLVPGNYHVNIAWTVDGIHYLQKEKLFIP